MNRQQVMALCGMTESLYMLVRLYCAQQLSEKEITDWFSEVEFEALRPEASCMAAAMASACNYSGVPDALIPRLRGIMKYVHTLNSGMAAGLCALGKKCNEAGISAMLLGSTAIHLSCPERPRRHMWQMEVGISEGDFLRAVELAENVGFTVERTPYSVTARQGNTQCVRIRKGMEYTQGATELTVGGVSYLLPNREELLVCLAQEICQILLSDGSGAKLLPRIMDLHCLIPTISDWQEVAAAAERRRTATQMRLVLELYQGLSLSTAMEGIVPLFSSETKRIRLLRLFLQYRKPNCSAFKRRWLGAQIRNDASFFAVLWKAVCRKFTPKG